MNKRRYTTPKVTAFGQLSQTTLGNKGSFADGNNNMTMSSNS